MKGIYILAISIIALIVIGVMFYYEDTHITIQAFVKSITYINTLPGEFILHIDLVIENTGFLPMSLTMNTTLAYVNGTTPNQLLSEPIKQYTNTTSISLDGMSQKVIYLTYHLPVNFALKYFSIEASGYYNYHYISSNNFQIIDEVNILAKKVVSLPVIPNVNYLGGNLSILHGHHLFVVNPYNVTLFSNSSYMTTLYTIFQLNNLNLRDGKYQVQVFVNNISEYSSTIQVPYQYNELLLPTLTTPLLSQQANYTATVYILFKGTNTSYYVKFEIEL